MTHFTVVNLGSSSGKHPDIEFKYICLLYIIGTAHFAQNIVLITSKGVFPLH